MLEEILKDRSNGFQAKIAVTNNYNLEMEAIVLYSLLSLVLVDDDPITNIFNQDIYLEQLGKDLIIFTSTTHDGKNAIEFNNSVHNIYERIGAIQELTLMANPDNKESLYITEEMKGIFGTHKDAVNKQIAQPQKTEDLLERMMFYRLMFKRLCRDKYIGEAFDINTAGRFLHRFISDDSYEVPVSFFGVNDTITKMPHIRPLVMTIDSEITQLFYKENVKQLLISTI